MLGRSAIARNTAARTSHCHELATCPAQHGIRASPELVALASGPVGRQPVSLSMPADISRWHEITAKHRTGRTGDSIRAGRPRVVKRFSKVGGASLAAAAKCGH